MHDGAMVTDQYPLLSLREALMTTYLEVFPAPRIAEQLSELPDGAYVGITCSPTNGLEATLTVLPAAHGVSG